jgi:hypothetical protein
MLELQDLTSARRHTAARPRIAPLPRRRRSANGLSLGSLQRRAVAEKLRDEADALLETMLSENRLSAEHCFGEAVGIRKAVSLLLAPNRPPLNRRDPWEIAETLVAEAGTLEKQIRRAGRLEAQRLYGQAVGLRRAAGMIELILD